MQDDTTTNVFKDEFEWTTTELRNSLRSIEWDLEDLDDTINILCIICYYNVYVARVNIILNATDSDNRFLHVS